MWKIIEHRRLADIDAGVHPVAQFGSRRRLFLEAQDAVVGRQLHHAAFGDVIAMMHQHRDQPSPAGAQLGVIQLDPVVAIHNEEQPAAEFLRKVVQRSRRAQQPLLFRIMNPHAELRAVAEVRADRFGLMVQIDPDVPHTGRGQAAHVRLQHRLVVDAQHRLGNTFGEAAEP